MPSIWCRSCVVALRRGEVEHAALDLREVLEEVLRLVGREAQVRDVQVTLKIADALPPVVGDRVQLQQVVLNLLSMSHRRRRGRRSAGT